ncbi:MAG: gamma-glutamyl-gamma-aminobutyrate hydrolase family protein [Chloroflexi bacterium]|nr:gamma-glutamyl-gamma-aminobutyrate hydrolase family protein [Chloroflexota bacterium]
MTPVIGITGRTDLSSQPAGICIVSVAQVYVDSVSWSHGAPVIVPPGLPESQLRAAYDRLDGLVLSGGGDIVPSCYGADDSGLLWSTDAARDTAEIRLARWALEDDKPVLGICRGIQVLNVAAGGTLIQDVATQLSASRITHSTAVSRPMDTVCHPVEIATGTVLAGIFGAGPLGVNSAHHQAILDPGSRLSVTARAPDGVIEAVEATDHPFCLGVQWHPEAMLKTYPVMRRLFDRLIAAARRQS